MNEEIEKIFKNFIVDNQVIPISFMKHEGNEETYIVYYSNGENPSFYGDDSVLASYNSYDFNIYTKGNFKKILKQLKSKLIENGWLWIEDSEDMYEYDTCFFHKVTTFSKERNDY